MSGVYLFLGVVIPYAAGAVFIFGLLYRIWRWAGAPVPFRIPTTSGQQKSLPWIKSSFLENPHNTLGVIGRMALEVLLFRSLLRNTTVELKQKTKKLIYSESLGLWLAALAFHWAMLIVLLRHLRFFTEPIPAIVLGLQSLDGVFEIAVPTLFITDIIILLALSYLILRRIVQSQVRFISLPSDYVAVLLILSVVFSGLLMRFFYKVDIVAVKELALGVVTFSPATPPALSWPTSHSVRWSIWRGYSSAPPGIWRTITACAVTSIPGTIRLRYTPMRSTKTNSET